jgi:hypothetical protein
MEKSPWLSIWTEPRATIRQIVVENPNRSLWFLATIYGFCSLLNLFQSMALGSTLSSLGILALALIFAPFWGYINFTIWSLLVSFVGKLFKGQGRFNQIRAAYSWSCVPLVINVPLWLLMVTMFGHQLFLNYSDAHLLTNIEVGILFAILITKVVLAVWSLVIYLNALAEVQMFSVLRAILNVIVAFILLGVLLFLFWSFMNFAFGEQGAPTAFIINHF